MTRKPKAYTLRLFATGDGEITIKDLASSPIKAPASGPVDLTHRAQGWTWSKVRKGGYWDASFSITGSLAELHQYMREWLAYRVEETAGIPNWIGMVWTMELSGVSVPRRVSMDQVYNAIRSEYREHLDNTGFEESGSGNVFSGWTDGTGAIADATGVYARGGHSASLTNSGVANGTIYQDITVEALAEYQFSVYTRGDGASAAGTVTIYDSTNASTIITESTGITRAEFRRVNYGFTAPAGCTSIRITLSNTNMTAVYFDEASMVRLVDGRAANGLTAYYTNTQSINRYGRKELTVNARNKSLAQAQTMAQTELKRRAWPRIAAGELNLGQQADRPTLTVYCVGYIVTTLYMYAPVGAGYEIDAGTLAKTAIDNKADFVTSRNVNTLGVKTRFSQDQPPRVFDLLQIISSEGASSDGVVEIKTDKDRGITIQPMLTTLPRYYLRGGELYDSPGSKNPTNARLVEPGLVKDLDYPGNQGFSDDIFDDSSLFIMEGVQVDDQNNIQPFDAPPSLRVGAEAR